MAVRPRANTMKTFLAFLVTFAAVLCGALLLTGRVPDPTTVVSDGFVAVLLVWTWLQYARTYPPLPLPDVTIRLTPQDSLRKPALRLRRAA